MSLGLGREMDDSFALDVRFYRLSAELQPFFTALYSFHITTDGDSMVRDRLHPEWSAMRFTVTGTPPIAAIDSDEIEHTWPFVASGPTSKAIRFGLKTSRVWGLGLQPAGWARYVAMPASEMADRIVDVSELPAFDVFKPILQILRTDISEDVVMAERVNAYLMEQEPLDNPHVEAVLRVQQALANPEIANVATLSEHLGINRRTLERLCCRYFGFPPKLLLRRQRFLRSLARYMLEPEGQWSKALDVQYYDHAHFVRDFRSFMGMTPTEYAEAPHPFLDQIMAQRMADQGAAPQTDLPTILRYGAKEGGAEPNAVKVDA